jgi:hypothetical protein
MMEALDSSETSVLTIATRRNIPEDGILLQFHSPYVFRAWYLIKHKDKLSFYQHVHCLETVPLQVTECYNTPRTGVCVK